MEDSGREAENVAKLAGKRPVGVTRSLEQSEAAGVDWRELLRRAWSETIPSDYSWMPPNRRHIWAGLYLPGVRSEGAGEIAIAVDCSGSNWRQLGLFQAEIRSILEGQRPSRVHVLYFDTEVHKAEVYQAGQPITLTPLAEEERTSSPASAGWTSVELCRRPWCSSQIYVVHSRKRLLFTRCCGPPRSRAAPIGQVIPMEAA